MWLICGLGNPDSKYKYTRHNLGFDTIDSLVKFYKASLIKKNKDAEIFRGKINNIECFFCKPLKFMNLSGPPIAKLLNFYKITNTMLLVIHDDLDLTTGKIKIKIGGGNGGHNGLSSIDGLIGNKYKRLRFGIGHPGFKEMVSSYVLQKFSKNDRILIDKKINLITKNFSLIFENDNLFLTRISN